MKLLFYTRRYVPVFFVLLQSKDEEVYQLALQACINSIARRFGALSVTCDFERGLIDALKLEFSEAFFVLCLFHFKQAVRRKLLEFGIPKELISLLMDENGLINILTVIPVEEIVPKGIPFIRAHFDEGEYSRKFDQFWRYFQDTWINSYDPNNWNINAVINAQKESPDQIMINRTNNPLKRLNRTLNELFGCYHPSMERFVITIKEYCIRLNEELKGIKLNLRRRPIYPQPHIFPIPPAYTNWSP